MIILKWTDLKPNQHVKLSCECEGFVKSLHFERDPLISGFLFLYTTDGCQRRNDLQQTYSLGQTPELVFFNHAMAEAAMPAEDVPTPQWWKTIQSDKTNPESLI